MSEQTNKQPVDNAVVPNSDSRWHEFISQPVAMIAVAIVVLVLILIGWLIWHKSPSKPITAKQKPGQPSAAFVQQLETTTAANGTIVSIDTEGQKITITQNNQQVVYSYNSQTTVHMGTAETKENISTLQTGMQIYIVYYNSTKILQDIWYASPS